MKNNVIEKDKLIEIRQIVEELKDKVAESGDFTFKNILNHHFFKLPQNDFSDELNDNMDKNSAFKFEDISDNQTEYKIDSKGFMNSKSKSKNNNLIDKILKDSKQSFSISPVTILLMKILRFYNGATAS